MVLVTGATGLLGSHLVKELAKNNIATKALYRTHIPAGFPDSIEWVKGDILDVVSLEEAFKNVTQVYHCAAAVSFNKKHSKELFAINVDGTANVVNACIHAGVQKLLHVSSVAALGRLREKEIISERMNWTESTSNSNYGKSKHLAEMEVWRGIGEGLNAVIINPSIIIGAGDWNKGSTEIFKTIYNEFPWYTEGISGFVDVQDVVRVMMILMKGTPASERFIVSAENLSYKDVFTKIAAEFGKKPPYKKVTPLLASIIWRIEAVKTLITNQEPFLTKEIAKTALAKVKFDNNRFKYYAFNFEYTPISESIKRICSELKEKYNLN